MEEELQQLLGPVATGSKRRNTGAADRSSFEFEELRAQLAAVEAAKVAAEAKAAAADQARAAAEAAALLAQDSLCSAADRGDYAAVGQLLSVGKSANEPDRTGATPLLLAAMRGHVQVVERLLDAAADPAATNGPQSPLLIAIWGDSDNGLKGHLAVVEVLLQRRPDLVNIPVVGMTPLLAAIFDPAAETVEIVQALLNKKADVHQTDMDGDTPLHFAANNGSVHAIEPLSQAGANFNARNKQGRTPLVAAIRSRAGCKAGMIDALLRGRANVGARVDSKPPLHWAVQLRREEAVRTLLAWGADRQATDSTGSRADQYLQPETALGVQSEASQKILQLLRPNEVVVQHQRQPNLIEWWNWFIPLPFDRECRVLYSSNPLQQPHRRVLDELVAAEQPLCACHVLQELLRMRTGSREVWEPQEAAATLRSIRRGDGLVFFGGVSGVLDKYVRTEMDAQRRTKPPGSYELKMLVGAGEHADWKERLVALYLSRGLYNQVWYQEHSEVFGDQAFTLMLLDDAGIACALTAKLACTVLNAPVVYISLMAKREDSSGSTRGTRAALSAAEERITSWMISELSRLVQIVVCDRCRDTSATGYIITQSVGYKHGTKTVDGRIVVVLSEIDDDDGRKYWRKQLSLVEAAHEYVFLAAQLCARDDFAEEGCAFLACRVGRGK